MTERTTIVIGPSAPLWRRVRAGLAELAAYRELLGYMTVNRLRLRYRNSWLGWAWALLQPLALLGFLSVVGLALSAHATSGIAYPLFILTSLSPWAFFATSLSTSAAGMLSSQPLIAKVYFPREIVPFSYVFAALADLAIATALAMTALACAGHGIPATAIELLPISLILILYAAAFSLLICVVQIGFRDVAIGLPLLLQGLMLTTPVLYPLGAVPEHWRSVYALNPLALLVEAYRGALIDKQTVSLGQLIYAAVVGLIVFGIAYVVFKTTEPAMVDEM